MSQCTCTRRDRSHVKEDVTAQAGGGGAGAAVTNHFQDFPHRLLNRALPQLISSQFLHVRLCPLSRFKKKQRRCAERARPPGSVPPIAFFSSGNRDRGGKTKEKGMRERSDRARKAGRGLEPLVADWPRPRDELRLI